MSDPRLSAIVPVFNGAAFLADALESALAQTFRDFEIIVIDDGSTDASGAIADAFAEALPDRIRVIHQPNGGFCASRNAGLAVARGEYIALLDCDDEWLPHHLADAVRELDRRPEVGLVHGQYALMDEHGRDLGTPPGRWRNPYASAWEAIFLRLEHVMCVTAVFRRRFVESDGGFDMRFNRLGCEDRDLWLRIAAASELSFLPDIQARYRVHGNNVSKQTERMVAARVKLVEKHAASGRGKALRHKALAAVHADLAYRLRTQGKFGPALKAYGRALSYAPCSWQIIKATLGAAMARR